ncbi:hypothetical protein QJS66_13445 [Kocuria rhizophila]|nr:hypothetical protein QJS66_13445 [Kocuria rhizophila]
MPTPWRRSTPRTAPSRPWPGRTSGDRLGLDGVPPRRRGRGAGAAASAGRARRDVAAMVRGAVVRRGGARPGSWPCPWSCTARTAARRVEQLRRIRPVAAERTLSSRMPWAPRGGGGRRPRCARAARNPVALFVPCHRCGAWTARWVASRG